MRFLGIAIAAALTLVACGGDDDSSTDDGSATRRACDGFAAVDEATKTGDEQAIRVGFEDMYAAASESDDAEVTSLVEDLRDADGDTASALAYVDLGDYCERARRVDRRQARERPPAATHHVDLLVWRTWDSAGSSRRTTLPRFRAATFG
jgi:hypothetical protein